MVLKPAMILRPCIRHNFSSLGSHALYLLRRTPVLNCSSEADEMDANMKQSPEGKFIVNRAVAVHKTPYQPQPGIYILVKLQLVEFCNHLAQVKGRRSKLAHLPVYNKKATVPSFPGVLVQ